MHIKKEKNHVYIGPIYYLRKALCRDSCQITKLKNFWKRISKNLTIFMLQYSLYLSARMAKSESLLSETRNKTMTKQNTNNLSDVFFPSFEIKKEWLALRRKWNMIFWPLKYPDRIEHRHYISETTKTPLISWSHNIMINLIDWS